MTITLFDLCGADDVRFSPYCWRVKLALAHKRLAYETVATSFTAIPGILDGSEKTVPVITDGEKTVRGSFEIAEYLENAYPDAPSLFGSAEGFALARFAQFWAASLHGDIATMVLKDIHDALREEDHAYFRSSREEALGASLEAIQSDREEARKRFYEKLRPLEMLLETQEFIGGASPLYADYIVFGSIQWPRAISEFAILPGDGSAIDQWFARCSALYGSSGEGITP